MKISKQYEQISGKLDRLWTNQNQSFKMIYDSIQALRKELEGKQDVEKPEETAEDAKGTEDN